MAMLTQDQTSASAPRGAGAPVAESYFALVQSLRHAADRSAPAVMIGVTGCAARAGVSTVATNVALAAAQLGEPTLLLDLSSSRPELADRLRMPGELGLREALSGEVQVAECARPTPIANLSLLGLDSDLEGPTLKVDGARIHDLLRSLEHSFRFVVVDLPVTDTGLCIATAGMLDGVLMVLESECTHSEAALRAKQRLFHANAKLLGVILNKYHPHIPSWLDGRL